MPEKPRIDQGGQAGNDLYAGGAILNYFPDPWAAFPFVSAGDTGLFAGFDPVVDKVSTPNFGGVVPEYKTASGTAPLHIADAVKGQIYSLLTNILPQQDLHGHATPWPAGGGKNIFDKDAATRDQYLDADGNTVVNNNWSVSDYIQVAEGSVYTISGYIVAGNAPRSCWYTSSKTFIESFQLSTQTTTVTAPTGAAYLRVSMQPAYANTEQIEQGSSASAFSPYSNICPISGWTGCNVYISPTTNPADATVYPCAWQDEAGTVYGGRIDIASGWMEVTHGIYIANGSEQLIEWILNGSSPNIAAAIALNNGVRYAKYVDGAKNAMCDRLESVSNVEMYNRQKTQGVCVMNNGRIAIQVEGISTLSDMTTWLTANTPQFVYVLETSQYYQIPAKSIYTLDGNNYIWTDCGNEITASYVAAK